MLKTANENKNTNIFLKDKILRGVTGVTGIKKYSKTGITSAVKMATIIQ